MPFPSTSAFVPVAERRFPCPHCKMCFLDGGELAMHLDAQHRKPTDAPFPGYDDDADTTRVRCPACPFTTNSQHLLAEHKKWTHDKKGLSKMERRKTNLSRAHLDRRIYKCEICSMVYCSTHALTMHRKKVHMNLPKSKRFIDCKVCGSSVSAPCISRHMREVHREMMGLPCPYPPCKHACNTERGMEQHVKKMHELPEVYGSLDVQVSLSAEALAKMVNTAVKGSSCQKSVPVSNTFVDALLGRGHDCAQCGTHFDSLLLRDEHVTALHDE